MFSSRDLPDPGIEPTFFMSPAMAGRFFTDSATWEAKHIWYPGSTKALDLAAAATILAKGTILCSGKGERTREG